VFILGGNHDSGRISSYPFKAMLCGATIEATSKGPIVVEDDVWIGMNSIVLSGVRLARGSVIGAGSVVTKDTEPYSINCGNPARLVRKRFDDALIGELMRIDYGRISESFIKSNLSLLYGDVSVDSIRKIIELYS
jgi:acetyltransferase-like isoleucine patch superfamily enzyme